MTWPWLVYALAWLIAAVGLFAIATIIWCGSPPKGARMKVRELVKALEQIQDQDAPVLIGEGLRPDLWLVVTGIVEHGIERRDALDAVGPGHEIGIEIV